VRRARLSPMKGLVWAVLVSQLVTVAVASAATRPPRSVVRPQPVAPATPEPAAPVAAVRDSAQFPSEEGVRRYLSARLLEQAGQLSEALGEYYRALALDPLATDLLVRISQVCAQLGDHARSLEFAERALAHEPDDVRALWLQGAARFSSGRAAEALVPLERACELDSTQAEVLRTTARVAETLRRPDVAERAWRRLLWLDDDDAEAWFQVAAAQARRSDFKGADASLEHVADLNPTRPGLLFLWGWVKENLDDAPAAVELYAHHLEVHEDDTPTRRRLVGLLMRMDRPREAYEQAQLVAQAQPEDPDALQVLADLALRLKRKADAGRALSRLRALDPESPENVARIVVVLAAHDRGREAARMADEWVELHPTHPAGTLLAVRAWNAAGVPDSAVVRARRGVAMAPDSVGPRRLLARTLQDARRYREAEIEWRALAKLMPEEPGVWLELAGCRERGGDVDGAIAAAREALRMAPDWAPAWNVLGYILADHNRELPEARRLLEKAIAQSPENGAYVDSYGWLLFREGRFAEARRELERAVVLTDGDGVVHEHLGDTYRALGLEDLARREYEAAREAGGENAAAAAAKLRRNR
jgi:tetratricopeptide (TPR) repeat protein